MEIVDRRDEDIPAWAISYIEYGDSSMLSDSEVAIVDYYMNCMKSLGYRSHEVTDDTNDFCAHPAFGYPSNTVRVVFFKWR